MKEKVVAVNKDPDGNILSVKTDQGQVYRVEQAIQQVESGRLTGIEVGNRNGQQFLKAASGTPENNLK
jgi:type II secretory pathway component GspD/PulD (secretin)